MHEMINELKQGLNFYLTHYGWIDFAAYIWLILLFLTVVFLCVYIMTKSVAGGLLLLILSFIGLGAGAFYTHKFLDENLRARQLVLISQKQLTYSDTLLVDLNLTNLSKKPFNYCRVGLKFYRPSQNFLKNEINMLKPFFKENVVLKEPLDANFTKEIRVVVDKFKFSDYGILIGSECF